MNETVLATYIKHKINFNLTFKAKPREEEIEMTTLNYLIHRLEQ